MGFDGFVDKWLKKTKRLDLLCDIWNNRTISKIKNFY